MHVQTLVAQATIERFDMGVVGGFSRPREIELHAAIKRPRFEGFRHELRPVIDGDRDGQSRHGRRAFKGRNDIAPRQ